MTEEGKFMGQFTGSSRLLLQDYFEKKTKLLELKTMRRFRSNQEHESEIESLETSIIEIISMFNEKQLREIIEMSLDIDYEELKMRGKVTSFMR
ncbi:hypothetical protein D3C87_624310 [compost metagenome]